MLTQETQMLVRLALRPAIFNIQVSRNRKCTKLPQSDMEHVTVKHTLYTVNTYTRTRPTFALFRSKTSHFTSKFYNSQLTTILTVKYRTKKKKSEFQSFKFYNSFNKFGRCPPRSIHDVIRGVDLVCTFSVV